ncbi:MAG: signal recognition particle protein [Candidatus Nitrosocaldaceae archaeon]|nr:MAG: signal recognition particle protein [Candidatus Nitrosocaldaceae archaeon]
MVLDSLKKGLRNTLKKLVGASIIDEALINEIVRDVQRSLLQSDVNVKLVLQVTNKIKERALNEQPPPGLSRKDHVVKILYEEISRLLGEERELPFKPGKLNTVLMIGIQGSGKTSATAKLARWLSKHGYKVGVIGADTYRPGALEQLKMMCSKINVEVYGEDSKDALGIVKRGMEHFKNSNLDVVIIDTAGRHKEEQSLLEEMKSIYNLVNPDLVLLVIDGTIGQQCYSQAEAFHKSVPVGGIIVTKLDGAAKGGGALSAAAATGATVMFISTGERIDDLEQFSPTRFVGRLLGMGDIKALLDMAKQLEIEADEKKIKRITSGKMTIDDFYYQLEQVNKMGSLRNIFEHLPGLSAAVKEEDVDVMEEKMKRWRYIIQSMTKDERANPDLFNASRIRRVARGSGTSEREVKELLTQYKRSKDVMKSVKGRAMHGLLKRFGFGK